MTTWQLSKGSKNKKTKVYSGHRISNASYILTGRPTTPDLRETRERGRPGRESLYEPEHVVTTSWERSEEVGTGRWGSGRPRSLSVVEHQTSNSELNRNNNKLLYIILGSFWIHVDLIPDVWQTKLFSSRFQKTKKKETKLFSREKLTRIRN